MQFHGLLRNSRGSPSDYGKLSRLIDALYDYMTREILTEDAKQNETKTEIHPKKQRQNEGRRKAVLSSICN